MFGAKHLLLAGLIVVIGGSLTTGLATGLGMLIAGRIAQGAAFAMILTMVIAMLILIAAFSAKGFPLVVAAAMFLLGVFMTSGMSAMTGLVFADVPAHLSGEAAGVQPSARLLICGFAMVMMTILLISVTAFQVQKVSLISLSLSDQATLDAVERLKRPAVSKRIADTASTAQRWEVERYDKILKIIRQALVD